MAALLVPISSFSESSSVKEPCEVENLIRDELVKSQAIGDASRCKLATETVLKVVYDWKKKEGVTARDAAELLQYVAERSTGVCVRIEVRWGDGKRGVVAEVESFKKGQGEVVWYLFKYRNEWRELFKCYSIIDSL